MKLGIFTQPLHNNYGGLLQCFALQTVLKRMGHDAVVVRRDYNRFNKPFILKFRSFIKNIIRVCIGRRWAKNITLEQWNHIGQHTQYFVNKYIQSKTPRLITNSQLKEYISKNHFDGYVVGSDQVWRPRYSPCITNYFLDFAENADVCRVAYAASFGVDEWEFSADITPRCAQLAQKFDAVSVREASAIGLCNQYLGVDALHVLDPTMLLEKEDYIAVVEAEKEPKSAGNLFCYVLDKAAEKDEAIARVADSLHLQPFTCMPSLNASFENLKKDIDACVFPPVTRWLRGFMDAEMVITDSFHGCAFSIIFNKPFWVIGIVARGMARFHSLLSIFGLESRLLDVNNLANVDWQSPIDWDKVNAIKHDWQEKSKEFLKSNLE